MKCGRSGCNLGSCGYSHNQYEIDYHPLTYKGVMCQYETEDGYRCLKLNERCPKAHGLNDLRDIGSILRKLRANAETPAVNITAISDISMIQGEFSLSTFRTLECPNKEFCKSPDCIHFHNELERRRSPDDFSYNGVMCSRVHINNKFKHPSSCQKGDKCTHCHTKNEMYYHKDNFKIKPCTRRKCPYGKHCPDVHEAISKGGDAGKYVDKIKELEKKNAKLIEELVNKKVNIRTSRRRRIGTRNCGNAISAGT